MTKTATRWRQSSPGGISGFILHTSHSCSMCAHTRVTSLTGILFMK